MEDTIFTAVLTALIAFVVCLINSYKITQLHISNSFVFTVTSGRVKWIETLRENISKFSSLIYLLYQTGSDSVETKKREEILVELKNMQTLIKLQLNPNNAHDCSLSSIIDDIFHTVEQSPGVHIDDKMDQLIDRTQEMLKNEWERVKQETQKVNITKVLGLKSGPAANNKLIKEFAATKENDKLIK